MTESPRVIGRYTLFGEIASGGMATVHFGRLLGVVGFSKTVAIKRLHAQYARDPEFVSMFLDEARLAARIQHPNVVSTLDVVALDGELFLVMEYVQGESLGKLVRAARGQGGWLPVPVVLSVFAGTLHGLHAAHEAKDESGALLDIVHRDISPQNILVGRDGVARVLDFGVAKASGRAQSTRDGQIKGKFAYMSPEQLMGKVSRTTDIYAASVVLWETLTGKRLFAADSEGELVKLVLDGRVRPPSELAPHVPAELDALTLRGLAREPGDRFPSAREMARAPEKIGPLATASEVGEVVENMAGASLSARADYVAQIESSSKSNPRPGAASVANGDGAGETVQTGPPEMPVPELDLAPRSSKPSIPSMKSGASPSGKPSARPSGQPSARPSARAGDPRPAPSRRPAPVVAAPSTNMSFDDDVIPEARIELDVAPLSARALSVSAPRRDYGRSLSAGEGIVVSKRRSSWGRIVLAVFVLLVAAITAAVFAAPYYVKSRMAERARRSGLAVTVDKIIFLPDALRLIGTQVGVLGLEGVSLKVGEVEIALEKMEPRAIVVHGLDVTLRGDARELGATLAKWAAALPQPLAIRGSSGHVTWVNPLGEGTQLDTFDTTISTASELHVSAPSLMVGTPRGKLGPWTIALSASGSEGRLTLGLDPSTPSSKMLLSLRKDGGVAVELDVTQCPLARLGIPADVLGLSSDPTVEAHMDLTRNAAGPVDGHVTFGLYALRFIASHTPASPLDVRLQAGLSGDSTDALALKDGAVGVGAAKGKVAGILSLKDRFAHADVSLTWSGAASTLPAALVLDTRDLAPRPPR